MGKKIIVAGLGHGGIAAAALIAATLSVPRLIFTFVNFDGKAMYC